jgi:hypothetical protein
MSYFDTFTNALLGATVTSGPALQRARLYIYIILEAEMARDPRVTGRGGGKDQDSGTAARGWEKDFTMMWRIKVLPPQPL